MQSVYRPKRIVRCITDDAISRQAVLDGKIVAVISDQTIEVVPVSHIDNISPSPSRPKVIHCKDCRWRNDYGHWLGCPVLNTDDNNYCSFAEPYKGAEHE